MNQPSNSFPYSQSQLQNGVNPAALASMQSQHFHQQQSAAYAQQMHNQQSIAMGNGGGNKFPYGGNLAMGGGFNMNPAMFQQGGSGQAQIGGGQMQQAINPATLMQPAGMNGNPNMQGSSSMNNANGGYGAASVGGVNITPQQYQHLAQMKAMGAFRQPSNPQIVPQTHQQQNQHAQQHQPYSGFPMNQQSYYERPSSSASHSSSNLPQNMNINVNSNMAMSMMPPPSSVPPRPPTAASHSRPGTARSHSSASNPNTNSNPNMMNSAMNASSSSMPGQRPPSRPPTSQGAPQPQSMNGYPAQNSPQKPSTPLPNPSHPYPQTLGNGFPHQPSGTSMPGSPYRGEKRKWAGAGMENLVGASMPSTGWNGNMPINANPGMGTAGQPQSAARLNGVGGVPQTPRMGSVGAGLPISAGMNPNVNGDGGMGGGDFRSMSPHKRHPSAAGMQMSPLGANMNMGMGQDTMYAQKPPGVVPGLMNTGRMGVHIPPTPSLAQAAPPILASSPSQSRLPSLPRKPMSPLYYGDIPVDVPPRLPTGSPVPPRPSAQPSTIPHLPPLPRTVTLNPATTRVTVVPLVGSDQAIPALTDDEINDIKQWMEKDTEYGGRLRAMKERMGHEITDGWVNGLKEIGGVSGGISVPAWWERDGGEVLRRRGEKFGVSYPRSAREGRSRKGGRREGLKLPRKIDPKDGNRPEQLVPIRLDLEVEHYKMRDTFVWNLNDPVITPEIFAQSVVEDYGLAQSYHTQITKSIQDQLSDFKAHSTAMGSEEDEDAEVIVSGAQAGSLGEEDALWWEGWRKRLRVCSKGSFVRKGRRVVGRARKRKQGRGSAGGAEAAEDNPLALEEIEVDEDTMREEMRIVIKLDIIVGSMKLDDQFEWDLNNEDASPEQFAEIYGKELGLVGEFKTAIAHSIREQIQTFQKSLFLVGHPSDGSIVQDDDLRMTFLPSLSSAARPIDQVETFTPTLNYLSDNAIEKSEREREKEVNRRRKRNTRGRRGVTLPDREPMRTFRTPAIGFPEVDAATLAAAAVVNVPTRRAAAAAASLTIANMVASENGTVMPTPQPQPLSLLPTTSTSQAKDKKPKGLFKPPEYPASVLRPRASVKPPIESTAMDASLLPPPLENDPPAPSAGAGPPDSKISVMRAGKAKTARELEREAKEKEYADGQHPNFIDGVWHCSNCGCPENVAIGRRKGPLGDKTQCGQCGKFWHRHRRPRPVDYNSSAEYHLNLKEEAERAKIIAKKKGGAAALRAQSAVMDPEQSATTSLASGARSSGPAGISRTNSKGVWAEVSSNAVEVEDDSKAEAISPISSGSSSASEPPLAQRMNRMNGTNHTAQSATPAPRPTSAADGIGSSTPSRATTSQPNPPLSGTATSAKPPEWLTNAMEAMQIKYPTDRFEAILKRVNPNAPPGWRIKCLDCPGKLYTPGPSETLSNYEVHLRNRQHRLKVTSRLGGSSI